MLFTQARLQRQRKATRFTFNCGIARWRITKSAAKVTCDILALLQKNPLRAGNILNINVPDIPYEEIKGIKVTVVAAVTPPLRCIV